MNSIPSSMPSHRLYAPVDVTNGIQRFLGQPSAQKEPFPLQPHDSEFVVHHSSHGLQLVQVPLLRKHNMVQRYPGEKLNIVNGSSVLFGYAPCETGVSANAF